MTEYIDYENSYTEFLIPRTSVKVTVRGDGSGYAEDMSDRDNMVVFNNQNASLMEDENIRLADEVFSLKQHIASLESTVAYHKEMKVAFRTACGDQRKEIDALLVKLAAVTQHRDALVSDHDNMLAALRVIDNATNMTLNNLEQLTQEVK